MAASLADVSGTEPPVDRLKHCESRIAERRRVGKHLGFTTFANPAWDMLLDLYRASLLAEKVSVSSLALASNVPPTTARRYIQALVAAKLIACRPDPNDRRRIWASITSLGLTALDKIFNAYID